MAKVPKKVMEVEELIEDKLVNVKGKKIKKSFFGILKGMGPFTKEDESWMEGKND